ncbi:DUF1415 domain-containing protein [Pseudomarimonas arenosa]|uniref:DUF1415 domain-containing protein n=1 Tax=Pseudomarimonas arenosa TaxID=2774145 RepID=A0AAW3ZSG2_9GAMM|nr:DUF1415 domain-containing protein [Pseudomarimonas arenosa]
MSTEGPDLDDAEIIAQTRRWLERAVIGLNLCPFARAPYVQKRVRFRVSHATDDEELLADLEVELRALSAVSADQVETVLLIHPWALNDFLDYNEFLNAADGCLEQLDLVGELQVASFHPHYQFADSEENAIENYSNRSPFPILHLLREASISRVVDALDDPDEIYRQNMRTLRQLGEAGWQRLLTPETPDIALADPDLPPASETH